jgi:hypothetical protein
MSLLEANRLLRYSRRCRSASLASCRCGNFRTRSSWSCISVRFQAVRAWAIYDSVMLVARARFRGPSLSCFSRFLVNSARSIGLPFGRRSFQPRNLRDISIRRGRPRNLEVMFSAATSCMPDSAASRCGSLRSAPHRSPHAIAGLVCY